MSKSAAVIELIESGCAQYWQAVNMYQGIRYRPNELQESSNMLKMLGAKLLNEVYQNE